ncbi:MAG: hypothetical protein ACREBP_03155 [Sphingomicrobium sp.]
MIPSTVVGTYTGTGAALSVVLGFKPDFLLIVNVTDGDIVHIGFRGLTAPGASVDIGAAVVANPDNALTMTFEGTNGEGFTVGTDASEIAKVYGYLAIRSGPGAS